MPLTYGVIHVRGWGETPDESYEAFATRFAEVNADIQARRLQARPGVAMRIEEPGNGGPCGPVAVRTQEFPYVIAIEDLPEFIDRKKP